MVTADGRLVLPLTASLGREFNDRPDPVRVAPVPGRPGNASGSGLLTSIALMERHNFSDAGQGVISISARFGMVPGYALGGFFPDARRSAPTPSPRGRVACAGQLPQWVPCRPHRFGPASFRLAPASLFHYNERLIWRALTRVPKSAGETMSTIAPDSFLYKMRHSLSHVLAQAVQQYRPGTLLGFGPPIDNGF